MSRPGLRQVLRRADWLAVLAIAPLLLFPAEGRAWALLAFPLVLGLQGWLWGEALPLTPLNPAILLLAVMTGVSLFVTPDLGLSLAKITGVLLGILVYFTVARHARSRPGWKGSLILLALAGMGVAGIGLLGTQWFTTKVTALNSLTSQLPVRLSGIPGAEAGIHPNELAGALLWVIPVAVMAVVALVREPKWFASRSGKGKVRGNSLAGWLVLLSAAILVCVGVLVLSQSRGGYLAIGISAIVVLVVMARGKWRWGVIGLIGVMVIAGLVLVSEVGLQGVVDKVVDNLPVGSDALSLSTLSGRVEIWSRAVWAIQDVPLTGLGMNVFRNAIYLLYPTFSLDSSYNLGHAHNEVLQAALDLGLPGLVGFLALYIGAAGLLFRAIRRSGIWRLLALGILGGLLAHLLYGIMDAVALGAKPGFLLWWLLGMAYGVYEQSQPVKVARR